MLCIIISRAFERFCSCILYNKSTSQLIFFTSSTFNYTKEAFFSCFLMSHKIEFMILNIQPPRSPKKKKFLCSGVTLCLLSGCLSAQLFICGCCVSWCNIIFGWNFPPLITTPTQQTFHNTKHTKNQT